MNKIKCINNCVRIYNFIKQKKYLLKQKGNKLKLEETKILFLLNQIHS